MAKKKKYGRMERFYAFLVSVLCISAAIIVAALVIQSKMDQGRDVAAQPASVEVSPSGTVGPLTLKALDTASTATATAAASRDASACRISRANAGECGGDRAAV